MTREAVSGPLTKREACIELGCGLTWFTSWLSSNPSYGYRVGREYRFTPSDIAAIREALGQEIPSELVPANDLDGGARPPSSSGDLRAFPSWMTRLMGSAAKNAARKGIPFDLTPSDARALIRRHAGRCAVSGIEFDTVDAVNGRRRPFAPSLDRVDSGKGYSRGNVRLVCQIVNMAMNEWGEEPLHELVRRMAEPSK